MKVSNPALTRLAALGRGGFFGLLLLGGGRTPFASAQDPVSCIESTVPYFMDEATRVDVAEFTEHVFCPDSTVQISMAEPPIVVFNPKIRFKCGESGERSENCVIRGVGPDDEFMPSVFFTHWSKSGIPENWPGGNPPDRNDTDPLEIEFHGFTFDGGQFFAASNVPTGVVFKDCAFINGASPGAGFYFANADEETPMPTAMPITAMPVTMEPTGMPTMNGTSAPTMAPVPATGAPTAPNTAMPTMTTMPTAAPLTGMPTMTSMPTAAPVTSGPTATTTPTGSPTLSPLGENECNPENPCPDPEFPCCSRFNFCGNTDDFCGPDNCISGCPPNVTETDAPTAMPVLEAEPTAMPVMVTPNASAPTAMPVPEMGPMPNVTDPTAMPVMMPTDDNATDVVGPTRQRLLWRLPKLPRASTLLAAAKSSSGRRRRAQDTPVARANVMFDMCDFGGNEIMTDEEGYGVLMGGWGAYLVFKECNFFDNSFVSPAPSTGNATMFLTTLAWLIDSSLDVLESCVTETDRVTALFAAFAGPDVEVRNTMNHGSDNTFITDVMPECNGIAVVEGADPDDPLTWTAECEAFTEDTCALDETMEPTIAPTEEEEETEEPTATPTMEPTPDPTEAPSTARAGAYLSSAAVIAAVSALFVALV